MPANLLIGAIVILATFLIHAAGLVALTDFLSRAHRRLGPYKRMAEILAMLLMVLGLFGIIMIEVAVWAMVFDWLGVVGDFSTALYFSTSNFATIGFGDIVPEHQWRLLAAIEGIGGFLLIGWSSAYLVSAGVRVGPFRKDVNF